MREIIIRVKTSAKGKWNYNEVYTRGDNDTVGQFTGLFDRERMPIYEGDILHVRSLMPESLGKEMCVAVEYDNVRAAFLVRNGEKYQQLGLCALENDVVVIGNIHDNPELLI